MRLALLGVLLLTACSRAPQCPITHAATAPTQPFLWRVSGPNGSLTIQATHQGVGGEVISKAAWVEVETTPVYVTEADEASAHAEGGSEPSPMFHLHETSLDGLIPKRDFHQLEELTNIDPVQLRRLKPWVAFMLLGKSQVSFPDRSMNRELIERARSHGARTVFLESWDDQARYLDAAITPRKLSAAIRGASNMQCDLERRIEAFRSGDDAVFANDIKPNEPIVARIDGWYAQLRGIVEGQRAFVAIGVGQLLGPYGLLARFASDGYQVRRL